MLLWHFNFTTKSNLSGRF